MSPVAFVCPACRKRIVASPAETSPLACPRCEADLTALKIIRQTTQRLRATTLRAIANNDMALASATARQLVHLQADPTHKSLLRAIKAAKPAGNNLRSQQF